MFRILGVVAALDARFGGNGLELQALRLLLLFMLGAVAAGGVHELRAWSRPTEVPRRVSLVDLTSGNVPAGSYVTVEGAMDPRYRIEITTRQWRYGRRRLHASSSTAELLPLVDDSRRAGLLVIPGDAVLAGRVALTGRVARLGSEPRRMLARDQSTLPSRMHADLMLDTTRREPNAKVGATMVAVAVPLSALLLYVRLRRGSIFRARPDVDQAQARQEVRHIDVRLTGRLRLDSRRSRRFLDMPVQATIDDRGDAVLGQHIDAGWYLYELCLRKRVGFWTIAMPPGSLREIVRGETALGTAVRPAARVRFEERDGRARTVTLSFGTVAQREFFLGVLMDRCGRGQRAA